MTWNCQILSFKEELSSKKDYKLFSISLCSELGLGFVVIQLQESSPRMGQMSEPVGTIDMNIKRTRIYILNDLFTAVTIEVA